ncbi:CPBP family intramembrane metalloprotease [Corynebacterium qintianiae]|uniref:CPBP family intramembrane metalloprotease n=1 Tax=Corynebacterium qintianiae TaxID=2709392 RepID=A0A7T0KMS4_9CORY|nr:CPBP family intramembrane glutamic endopeptidase [Corynebacterium qintianiae]QPK83231.1 CPBP family intramembrane metalloprotease [Corynebacterium qintianiae]
MTWWDLVALTAVFFGTSIVSSVMRGGVVPAAPDSPASAVSEFTTRSNWNALVQQGALLAVAITYICVRRVKLARWTMRPTLKGTVLGIGLFAGCGLLFDAVYTLRGRITGSGGVAAVVGEPPEGVGADPFLLVYSMFNGFYEEFFFLAICLSLPVKWHRWAVAYSFLVRTSFHTYQGVFNALLIGVVFGAVFYAVARRWPPQRIYPFVVAHALGDILGIGLIDLIVAMP